MDLHSIVTDVAELPAEGGFRRYEPIARVANFVPEPAERERLFLQGAVIIVMLDPDGRFLGIAVTDKVRAPQIVRQGGEQ